MNVPASLWAWYEAFHPPAACPEPFGIAINESSGRYWRRGALDHDGRSPAVPATRQIRGVRPNDVEPMGLQGVGDRPYLIFWDVGLLEAKYVVVPPYDVINVVHQLSNVPTADSHGIAASAIVGIVFRFE